MPGAGADLPVAFSAFTSDPTSRGHLDSTATRLVLVQRAFIRALNIPNTPTWTSSSLVYTSITRKPEESLREGASPPEHSPSHPFIPSPKTDTLLLRNDWTATINASSVIGGTQLEVSIVTDLRFHAGCSWFILERHRGLCLYTTTPGLEECDAQCSAIQCPPYASHVNPKTISTPGTPRMAAVTEAPWNNNALLI